MERSVECKRISVKIKAHTVTVHADVTTTLKLVLFLGPFIPFDLQLLTAVALCIEGLHHYFRCTHSLSVLPLNKVVYIIQE